VKLVADESVEGPTVSALREAGHQVLFIAESSPGINDSAVLEIASREDALLLTADKDFGELVFRNGQTHSGVLLIRSLESVEENAANVLSAISQYGSELRNRFSVLASGAVRIRRTKY
jgi:predicted nuclease of predicted toxin-antitoxin system